MVQTSFGCRVGVYGAAGHQPQASSKNERGVTAQRRLRGLRPGLTLEVMLASTEPRPSRRASTSSLATSRGPTALVLNTLPAPSAHAASACRTRVLCAAYLPPASRVPVQEPWHRVCNRLGRWMDPSWRTDQTGGRGRAGVARRIMASSVTSSRWSHCAMPALLTTYCAGTVLALRTQKSTQNKHERHFLAGHAGRQAGEGLRQSAQAPKPNASRHNMWQVCRRTGLQCHCNRAHPCSIVS